MCRDGNRRVHGLLRGLGDVVIVGIPIPKSSASATGQLRCRRDPDPDRVDPPRPVWDPHRSGRREACSRALLVVPRSPPTSSAVPRGTCSCRARVLRRAWGVSFSVGIAWVSAWYPSNGGSRSACSETGERRRLDHEAAAPGPRRPPSRRVVWGRLRSGRLEVRSPSSQRSCCRDPRSPLWNDRRPPMTIRPATAAPCGRSTRPLATCVSGASASTTSSSAGSTWVWCSGCRSTTSMSTDVGPADGRVSHVLSLPRRACAPPRRLPLRPSRRAPRPAWRSSSCASPTSGSVSGRARARSPCSSSWSA